MGEGRCRRSGATPQGSDPAVGLISKAGGGEEETLSPSPPTVFSKRHKAFFVFDLKAGKE